MAMARAMFLFSRGGSIDMRMGVLLTLIILENLEKFFVQAFSDLCHHFDHGLDVCFVPLASL